MSSWYPPLFLKGWEDNDPITYRQVEGHCKWGVVFYLFFFFFENLGPKFPTPLLVINDRSHRDRSLITIWRGIGKLDMWILKILWIPHGNSAKIGPPPILIKTVPQQGYRWQGHESIHFRGQHDDMITYYLFIYTKVAQKWIDSCPCEREPSCAWMHGQGNSPSVEPFWPLTFFPWRFQHVQSYRIISWDDQNLNWDWDLGEKLTGTWDWDLPIKTPMHDQCNHLCKYTRKWTSTDINICLHCIWWPGL